MAASASTIPKSSASGLRTAFKPASRSTAPPPPALNQQEDQPAWPPSPPPPAVPPPAVAEPVKPSPISKHYFQWGVSVQEQKIHTGLQTEVHLYMKRPPTAPIHVSNLAASLLSLPIIRSLNTSGREWSPALAAYLPTPSDAVPMDAEETA